MMRRRLHSEGGFTLVELIVVLTILAILLLLAGFMFLRSVEAAGDRAAQAALRHALGAATIHSTDQDSFLGANAASLSGLEPDVDFVDAPNPAAGPGVVSVTAPNRETWIAVSRSRSGTCFGLKNSIGIPGGVTYARTDTAPCEASQAWVLGASDSTW